MIGAIGSGGMTALLWRQAQYSAQYAARTARGAAVAAPAAGQETKAPLPAAAAAGGAAAGAAFSGPELPYVPNGYGPVELAARTRLLFPSGDPAAEESFRFPWEKEDDGTEEDVPGVKDTKSPAETMEEGECKTCEKRKYQDGSDDPGVSFKSATHVDPKVAASAVRGHEMEHVVRERAKAEREGRRVVSQSVTYHTGICPECGKFYVSGGTTRTVTAADKSGEFLKKALEDSEPELDITA